MNETGKGFRISAWGAAALAASSSVMSSVVLILCDASNPLWWFGESLLLSLAKVSGCLWLAYGNRHVRSWLMCRISLLVIIDVMAAQFLWRSFYWFVGSELIWRYEILQVLELPEFIVSALVPFVILRKPRSRHLDCSSQRIPLIVCRKPLPARVWFAVLMVVVVPWALSWFLGGFIGGLSGIYSAPSNQWFFLLLSSLKHSVYYSGYMAYFLTRLAEWSIYQQHPISISPSTVTGFESESPPPEPSVE